MTGLLPEQTQTVSITLPDGSQRHFDRPVAVTEVAAAIGAGLARNTVAGKHSSACARV